MTATLKAAFAAAMASFEPVSSRPRLTVGVSGGADSMALVLLAQEWTAALGGSVLALIVDHGIRPGSDAEADLVRERLKSRGIAAKVIKLAGLGPTKLQEKARQARHDALSKATRQSKTPFLLLGHHAADQSETVEMRAKRGDSGLEGMASWTARNDVILLRPLLGIAPTYLSDFLRHEKMPWVVDPSNSNPRFERVRVRLAGTKAVPKDALSRQQTEIGAAEFLARHATIRPEGFAIVSAHTLPTSALASLIKIIGGSLYAPNQRAVAKLAERLQPATLGGVRILEAGRLGPGWLVVREPAACMPAIPAKRGAVWDSRFRLRDEAQGGLCGAIGEDASLFRHASNLPAVILRSLPCIRHSASTGIKPQMAKVFFTPPIPAASLPFGGHVSALFSPSSNLFVQGC